MLNGCLLVISQGAVSAQWSLRQASEAITQFYAAHGYTNVKVDVSTAAFNGAMPEIRIVEDALETSRLSLP
jgi:outer membrane protein assembly factor BamA